MKAEPYTLRVVDNRCPLELARWQEARAETWREYAARLIEERKSA